MEFKNFCTFLQTVKNTKDLPEKTKLIQNQLIKYKELFQTVKSEESIFDVLRLMLPKLDRDRASYNMKEPKIARALVNMLDLPDGNDKNTLTKSHLSNGKCDFAEIVYFVIRKYIANNTSTLSIRQINSYLDDLTNRKSERETEEILLKMFKNLSPEDCTWIIRIILKTVKIGIDANSILKCFHPDAADYYTSNSNLKKVCETLSNPDIKLHELEIKVFDAFRPMLSKRIDASTFAKCIKEDEIYYVENKFDGERFQLHMQANEFKYFSRNGFNYTAQFGESYDNGIFTPKLRNLFDEAIFNVILDGEMMLFNKETKTFGSKGMSMDVKKLIEEKRYAPCFCIYDILLLNNKTLTNQPYTERFNLLREVIQEKTGVIMLSKHKKVHNRREVVAELNAAVDKEDEGIILKEPNSIYKYSDRNSGWYKMKLDYFNDVMNDMDVLLIGGSSGSYTSSRLTKFIVGVRSGTTTDGKPMYLAFGRVGSGLTMPEIDMLNTKLKTEGFPWDKFDENKRNDLVFGREKPDYWIEPTKSLVLLIRATELTHSDNNFRTPYTLRFPRILSIRYDKPVDECMTINDVLDLCQQNKPVIKLNKRNIQLEEILKSTVKRSKKQQKIEVSKINEVSELSAALNELTVYVLNGTAENSKEHYENMARRLGGKVIYKINELIDIILVGNYTEKVSSLISTNPKYDIISTSWIERVLNEGETVSYENEDVFYIGWNYANFLADQVDMYGDSYTAKATESSLKRTFKVLEDRQEILYRDDELMQSMFPKRFRFANYSAYFDEYENVNQPETESIYESFLDKMEFQYQNGTVTEKFDCNTNLIVYNGNEERHVFLKNYLQSIDRSDVKIVPKTFIESTIKE